MKRTYSREDIDTYGYEVRNNRIRLQAPLSKVLFQFLMKHDVGQVLDKFIHQVYWNTKWYSGHLQIFTSCYDNGDRLYTEWSITDSATLLFTNWWTFLSDVKVLKRRDHIWRQLTVQKSIYWSFAKFGIHSWESIHMGQAGEEERKPEFEFVETNQGTIAVDEDGQIIAEDVKFGYYHEETNVTIL